MGMCGPLVMMLGRHRYRHLYFAGRCVSYALAGLLAGTAGAVINASLRDYLVAATVSLLFGCLFLVMGMYFLLGWSLPQVPWLAQRVQRAANTLSLLLLKDLPWASFLFGFATLFLPCGQTALVFSACALAGDPWIGLGNGLALAVFTSPSLFISMQSHGLFRFGRDYYHFLMGGTAILVGALAIARGLAEAEIIPHLILNETYHLVIY